MDTRDAPFPLLFSKERFDVGTNEAALRRALWHIVTSDAPSEHGVTFSDTHLAIFRLCNMTRGDLASRLYEHYLRIAVYVEGIDDPSHPQWRRIETMTHLYSYYESRIYPPFLLAPGAPPWRLQKANRPRESIEMMRTRVLAKAGTPAARWWRLRRIARCVGRLARVLPCWRVAFDAVAYAPDAPVVRGLLKRRFEETRTSSSAVGSVVV